MKKDGKDVLFQLELKNGNSQSKPLYSYLKFERLDTFLVKVVQNSCIPMECNPCSSRSPGEDFDFGLVQKKEKKKEKKKRMGIGKCRVGVAFFSKIDLIKLAWDFCREET